MTHRVVIVGGGFGGLAAARGLRRARNVAITLVDRRNFHLFQPLLYQVATGGLSPANIAAPLRTILKRQRNVRTLLGEVATIDPKRRIVAMSNGEELSYDSLVLATGARHHYFGHDEQWEPFAPGLKTIEDATDIRRRVLAAFEQAEQHAENKSQGVTFVVVGGGPTGVEMAGALGELARYTMRGEFRAARPESARVILVEGLARLLSAYPEKLSAKALAALERLGVEVWLNSTVSEVGDGFAVIDKQGDVRERVECDSVVWAAGVKASSLTDRVAETFTAETDRAGRIIVTDHCEVPGQESVFAIGDMAHFDQAGKPLPGVAPVAVQQGAYVARVIRRRLRNQPTTPFRYKDKGQMATIGRGAAVAQIGRWKFNGYLAWLAWLFVHLMQLVGFQNRALVLVQWAWNYFTRNRSARLITQTDDDPPRAE